MSDAPRAPSIENLVVRLLPNRGHGTAVRYGTSALIILSATGLRYALEGPLQHFPLLLFIPAVFLCALLFDRGSGFFATILSAAIAAYLFIEPRFTLNVGMQAWLALAIFVLIGFTMSAVTELLRKTITKLNESEAAKALLLEELAHRTKNDLSIISAAMNLQSRASNNPEVRAALDAANARVLVVAQAQERLRESRNYRRVNLADYVGGLCHGLGDLLRDVRPIAVRVKCDPIDVAGPVAVQLGLIVNELVTNSFKYAYPGESGGIVRVEITQRDSGLEIIVSDDGIGCDAESKPGLGSKLVRLLAKQLGGKVERRHSASGFTTAVFIPDVEGG